MLCPCGNPATITQPTPLCPACAMLCEHARDVKGKLERYKEINKDVKP